MAAADLSGLDDFNPGDLITPGVDDATSSGSPLYIPIDNIDEDPDQPRQEFDEKSLKELSDSMAFVLPNGKPRGVLSPISVKKQDDGRYVINHGARRYRAAVMAGLTEIPAFVDDDHDAAAQVIENIQRDNLSPLEIARYVCSQIDAGRKKKDIASELGKPASFITEHSVFFDFPDSIRSLYDLGKCRNIQSLYALYRQYRNHPEAVDEFCQREGVEFSKAFISSFVDELAGKGAADAKNKDPVKTESNAPAGGLNTPPSEDGKESGGVNEGREPGSNEENNGENNSGTATQPKKSKLVIVVSVSGVQGHLVTNRPGGDGTVWVTLDGKAEEVPISSVQLLAVTGE